MRGITEMGARIRPKQPRRFRRNRCADSTETGARFHPKSAVIGRFPGETSCLSLCWAVLDLVIAGARGLGMTDLDHQEIARLRSARAPMDAHALIA